MDRWGPKHVELKPKCWLKNLLSETTLCISLDYIIMYIELEAQDSDQTVPVTVAGTGHISYVVSGSSCVATGYRCASPFTDSYG